MGEKQASPLDHMGYLDGRQVATETALGLLFLTLDEQQRKLANKILRDVMQEFSDASSHPEEFRRGFYDAMKRLDVLSQRPHKFSVS